MSSSTVPSIVSAVSRLGAHKLGGMGTQVGGRAVAVCPRCCRLEELFPPDDPFAMNLLATHIYFKDGRFREAYKYSMRGVATASREDRSALLLPLYGTVVQAVVLGALGPTFTLQQVDQLLAAHAAALDRCSAWIPSASRKFHLELTLGTRWKSLLGIPADWPSNRCDSLHYFLRTGRDTMSFNRVAELARTNRFILSVDFGCERNALPTKPPICL